jgi:hypothetical protein
MNYPEYQTLNANHCRELYIKTNYNEFYEYIINNYPKELSFGEKLYWFYNNITEQPKCKKCGNKTKFINALKGYSEYCCKKCSNSSNEKITKTKQTNNIRFGGNAPACSKDVINKMKQTNLERYGDENFNNRESANKTLIERYNGIGNASEIIKSKQQQTCIERYGVNNGMKAKEIVSKIKANNKKYYGVEWVFQRPEIQQKSIDTCIERYGTEHYTNPEKARQTIKENNLEKYGVEHTFQRKDVKQKSIDTCIERYGTIHYTNPEKARQTIKENNLEKYGVEHTFQRKDVKQKSIDTCIKRYGKQDLTNITNHMQLDCVKTKIIETKRKNKSFNTSAIEEDFTEYLNKNCVNYKRQYKSKEYPYACDFYFPDNNLYLEIQAMWTHGGHPFNPNLKEDQTTLQEWQSKNNKFYNCAINTWTVRDVLKRETAKKNNLNYLEVFTTNINILINEYKRAIK